MTYVAFDVETSGKVIETSQIIEITAYKLDDNFNLINKFSSLVSYPKKLPKEITQLTGITDDMIKDEGQDYHLVMNEFCLFTNGSVLVAHNAEFDLGHVYQAYALLGIVVDPYEFYDTLYMSRNLIRWSKDHKLNTLCVELGVDLSGHHRSENDVKALVDLFRLLYRMMNGRNREYKNSVYYIKEPSKYDIPLMKKELLVHEKIEKMFFD